MEGNLGNFPIVAYIKRYWIYGLLGFFAINSLVLDFFVFFPKAAPTQVATSNNKVNFPNVPQISCPQSCVDKINIIAATRSGNVVVSTTGPTAVATLIPTPTTTVTSTPTPTPAAKTVKEFFIPFGVGQIGSGNSSDWTVIDGIGAKIDPADYGDIKTVTFEVSARIPTGNQTIWIRLYNSSTYQSIAGSELSLSGGTATLLVSSPITLTSGNNLYKIQIKTQLQYPANIDMARIRIKTI